MSNGDQNTTPVVDEAKVLGVDKSKTNLSSYKTKGPADTAREAKKQEELIAKRVKNRVAKKKALAKKKPIEVRRALLTSRFKAIRARTRPNNYSEAMINAWIEELKVIDNNPKLWNKETNNGQFPYPRPAKGKRSAQSLLDSMDLD
jgi:hypothetical protein